MNNKQSTILTILILLITVTNGLSIAEPVLAFIPTIATGTPTLSSTLVTAQNVTSTVTATVTRLASTAAPTAAVPSATPTRTATKTSTSVITNTVVATATPTDDNTEVIIDLTLGTPQPPITSLDDPTPTPKVVPTYFSFPWSVYKPKSGTTRNSIATATPRNLLANAKSTPSVVAKTGTPVTTPLPRSTHVSVPSGSLLLANPLSGSTPTRIAMAQGNPDIQIIESQTSDTIDTTEQVQQDSSYFVRQLAKVGIIFVIGGLLLGSGVLSITALFFVWRTYFR
jgi:hypothetical protein